MTVIKCTYYNDQMELKYHYLILEGTSCTDMPYKVFRGLAHQEVVVDDEL